MNFNESFETCLQELGRYVLPICLHHGHSKTPFFIGSGIPIELADGLYFATAAHVVDGANGEQLWIAGNSKFHALEGPCARWVYSPGAGFDHDIVVYKLDDDARGSIEPFYRFIQEADLSVVDEFDKFTLYAFIGYPHSKNKPRPASLGKSINCTSFYYVVREFANLVEINATDKSNHMHIAFKAPQKAAVDLCFDSKQAPKPQGISGCPVFKIKIDANIGSVSSVSLVGIGIEYLQAKQAFVATRSEYLIATIRGLQQKLNATDEEKTSQ